MNKKIISAGLAMAMLFSIGSVKIPARDAGAKSASVKRIVFGKTYSSFDMNGDGKNDNVTFYPNYCKKNTCKGIYSVSMFAGEPHVQWVTIDNRITGSYYYNMKAKKPKDTGTELYLVSLKNGKTFFAVNFYSKKNKYKDTQIYAYKRGKVVRRRSKYTWREDKYVVAAKVTADLKKSGLKSLKLGSVSKNMIKFSGSFKNKLLGEFKADVYYGYKSAVKLVRYTASGKVDKKYILPVKSFKHYSVVTDPEGNKTISTSFNKSAVTARYKLGLYKDAAFKKPVTNEAEEPLVLLEGDKTKITGIYVRNKKTALYTGSSKGKGFVTFVKEADSDTDALGEDGVMFEELKKPVITDDDPYALPERGDEDPFPDSESTPVQDDSADTVIIEAGDK